MVLEYRDMEEPMQQTELAGVEQWPSSRDNFHGQGQEAASMQEGIQPFAVAGSSGRAKTQEILEVADMVGFQHRDLALEPLPKLLACHCPNFLACCNGHAHK